MSSIVGTLIVGVILAAIVALIIYSMIKDRKQGKRSCGGNCGCCPNSCNCHAPAKPKK
ncbi:MAG: FeoB-associated Cys-rich membrane protein [Ruminococcus sp.]|nr:FeoB-associated Cys-rich membrane protein [Ruminococcus sp.]